MALEQLSFLSLGRSRDSASKRGLDEDLVSSSGSMIELLPEASVIPALRKELFSRPMTANFPLCH